MGPINRATTQEQQLKNQIGALAMNTSRQISTAFQMPAEGEDPIAKILSLMEANAGAGIGELMQGLINQLRTITAKA